MIHAQIQLLKLERKTVGWFHLLHLILTVSSLGSWLLIWIIHIMVVASFNSTLNERIKVTQIMLDREATP